MSIIDRAKMLRARIESMAKDLTDEDALETIELFPTWKADTPYVANYRVRYNDVLYKCVQAHTSQSDWTPDITPALWTRVSIDEFPEWVQPTGVQDAYMIGDKVTYNNKHWESYVDNNVWKPDVYGWNEIE